MKQLYTLASSIALFFTTQAQTVYQVSTFAGSGVSGSTDATGTGASFSRPIGVCRDASGNTYVTDFSNNKIRKITPTGVVTTFAGSGVAGSTDATGLLASFRNPTGLCADAAGNIYVADTYNDKIRKITPTGGVTTFVGSGVVGAVDATGLAASFSGPWSICIDPFGNFYVPDTYNHKIRKITPAGVVTTFAGSGFIGSTDATGLAASFYFPTGVCSDASGNIYVADLGNHKIRKITQSGIVSTIAGSGIAGSIDATGVSAMFNGPYGICIDALGNLFVTEEGNNKVRKITQTGVVTTLAGSGQSGSVDALGLEASFKNVSGICIDASNNIYVGDRLNHKIRKITVTTPAPPAVNYLNLPGSLCMGGSVNYQPSVTGSQVGGNITIDSLAIAGADSIKSFCQNGSHLFVLDNYDNINKYDFSGNLISTFFANIGTTAITTDKVGKIYMVHPDGNNPSINTISRMHANGSLDFSFISPQYYYSNISAIALGRDGYLYVADTTSGYIDKVDTLNGTPQHLPTPNNLYSYYKPTSIAFDKNGQMLLADIGHNTIMYRNASDNNYYPLINGLDTLNLKITHIGLDTVGFGSIYASSTITQTYKFLQNSEFGWQNFSNATIQDGEFLKNGRPMGSVFTLPNGTALMPRVWVAEQSPAKLKNAQMYSYIITPALPAGLSYDFNRGNIVGTPTIPTPSQTYTITVNNPTYGNSSTTITFGVSPSGFIGNTPGTASSLVNQADGLKVTYKDQNNCSKMIDIEDKVGGTVMGNTQVTQTVVPTIASFASGKFVGRVTEVSPQDPKAKAKLKLYFTYTDIENYNLFNGAGTDLSNDTTITKMMQVGVLQLHRDSTGVEKQIKHNPITANWISKEKAWVVDFEVQKFSTFYMAASNDVTAFTCASAGATQSVTSCGDYFWRGQLLTTTGLYNDTTANMFGCDSALSLNLTVNNLPDLSTSTNGNVLSSNETGATYKWINCNTNTAISGATSQNYTVTGSGSYAVVVTKNNCSDTSACVPITITGLETLTAHEGIVVHPNPNNGLFKMTTHSDVFVNITNSLGQTVFEGTITQGVQNIDLTEYTDGVYYVTINKNNELIRIKLVKTN